MVAACQNVRLVLPFYWLVHSEISLNKWNTIVGHHLLWNWHPVWISQYNKDKFVMWICWIWTKWKVHSIKNTVLVFCHSSWSSFVRSDLFFQLAVLLQEVTSPIIAILELLQYKFYIIGVEARQTVPWQHYSLNFNLKCSFNRFSITKRTKNLNRKLCVLYTDQVLHQTLY